MRPLNLLTGAIKIRLPLLLLLLLLLLLSVSKSGTTQSNTEETLAIKIDHQWLDV
jgi:hypothetical protein